MKTYHIALVALVAVAGLALTGAAPVAEDVMPVGTAEAKPCVIGQSGDCVVPVQCVTDMPPCDREYP